MAAASARPGMSLTIVIIAGCLMAMISMGVRSSFGLFVDGAPGAIGVTSGDFGLALGWQNLLWGLIGAYAASLVDRFGPMWVLIAGALMYGLGMLGMLTLQSTFWTYMLLGVLTGGGVAATGFSIIGISFSKLVTPEQRSWALGLGRQRRPSWSARHRPAGRHVAAAAGLGAGDDGAGGADLLIIPLSFAFAGIEHTPRPPLPVRQAPAVVRSLARSPYPQQPQLRLLFFGSLCAASIAFVYIYLPKFLIDQGVQPQWLNGWAGSAPWRWRWSACSISSDLPRRAGAAYPEEERSCLHLRRAVVVMLAFILIPISPLTTLIFASAMGLLWLSTVPLTQGIIGGIFGIHMTTLYAIAFVSHQVGSFSATLWPVPSRT